MQQDNIVPRQKQQKTADVFPMVQLALQNLASAYGYACDAECDPWQFAVEISLLNANGVSMGTLRWLVMKGYVEHAFEITRPNNTLRKFRPGRNLAFNEQTCFVITDAGLSPPNGTPAIGEPGRFSEAESVLPHWDREARILCVGRQIVKQYRVPSPNQEAVLAAFQEEGWPKFIHDPLSPAAEQPPKQRLRETIRGLNTNQKNALVRFRGDGTGERVGWEVVDASRSRLPTVGRGLRQVPTSPSPSGRGSG
jgi:hypothetical protein